MSVVSKGKKVANLGLQWFRDIYRNRKLILDLANKDFKSRYAASYLGIIWAFVQPIVTVAIYILVFQLGFKAKPVRDVPYALWLVVGIVPWLFFQEALLSATNSLIEFSYLVKKVVFKISVLPMVKIISAFYVHIFFVGVAVILYFAFGYTPHLYMIQVIYYTFRSFFLYFFSSYFSIRFFLYHCFYGGFLSRFGTDCEHFITIWNVAYSHYVEYG